MHKFQSYPIERLELNPFSKIGKEWMLIASGNEEKANAMTASWGGMGVLWGKNVAYIVVRESRYTKEFLDRESAFSVTFFDPEYKKALQHLGTVSGRDEDKITAAGLHLQFQDGVPIFEEAGLVFVCRKLSATPILKEQFIDPGIDAQWYSDQDYHTMYVGEIVDVLVR